eukprot:TRINITY_DN525_c0_g1_i1.p1 TRINITY_DN525_c0_g1~~TRINITY_DN525_c0_g1_i1.p1  ORF type:complete len:305 (-),score=94.81 TRINITY_DN525_c0_g1_i1:381-1295(-)
MEEVYAPIYSLEKVIGQDLGKRGISELIITGSLFQAADSLMSASNVVILTGFCIPPTETDGPPGAAILARTLLHLGASVTIVSDKPNEKAIETCLDVLGISSACSLKVFPVGPALQLSDIDSLLTDVTHVVSIERVGPSEDGCCYNMSGQDITGVTAPLHMVVEIGKEKGAVTIGIGDGGNEIGMGKVRDKVSRFIRKGSKIGCVIQCDHLIVSGVSNWGGMGLAAAILLLKGVSIETARKTFIDSQMHHIIVQAMMEKANAIDGVTKKSCPPSVDGMLVGVEHRAVIDEIWSIMKEQFTVGSV